jgi:methionyl-tRNA formyltransferase
MQERVDTGPIAATAQTPILPSDTAETLYLRTISTVRQLFTQGLDLYLSGRIPKMECIGELRFYKRDALDALRDLTEIVDADLFDRIVRAAYFPPHPPAYLRRGKAKVFLIPETSLSHAAKNVKPANACTW